MYKFAFFVTWVLSNVYTIAQNINVSNNTEQDYYDFHPLSTLSLGKTFDPNHLGDSKLMPIKYTERKEDIQPNQSALFTSFDVYMVTNKEELQWAFSYDSKVSARAFKVKASSSFSLFNNFEFKSNSVYLVVNAKSEFSRISIDNVEFTDLGSKYINKPKRFEEMFGSKIVTMVRKGIALWILVSIDDVSYNLLNKIRYTTSASGKFGPLKGSAEMDIKSELKYMRDRNKINIQIFSNGGKSIGDYDKVLTALTANANDFSDLKKIIANDLLKNISIEDAAPIGYHTTSIKSLGVRKAWKLKDKITSSQFETILMSLSNIYNQIDDQIVELNNFLKGTNPKAQLINSTEIGKIKTTFIPKLEEYKNQISDLHTNTLYKYDEINEDDFDNKKGSEFIQNINVKAHKIQIDLKNQYPIIPTPLTVAWNASGALEIASPKMEHLMFRVYYDVNNAGVIQSTFFDFSNLCFLTDRPLSGAVLCRRLLAPPGGPTFKEETTRIWGRLDIVRITLEDIKLSITEHSNLHSILIGSFPNNQKDFDVYINLKSPFIGEKNVLIGKIYFDRTSNVPPGSTFKKMNVDLYDNIFLDDQLRFIF